MNNDLRERVRTAIETACAVEYDLSAMANAAIAECRVDELVAALEHIIQVRGGIGMFEGKEALDEMARLAGDALASLKTETPETEGAE